MRDERNETVRPVPAPRPRPTPAPRPDANLVEGSGKSKNAPDPQHEANKKVDALEKDVRSKVLAQVKNGSKPVERVMPHHQDVTVSGNSLQGEPFSFVLKLASETPEREVLGAISVRVGAVDSDSIKIEAIPSQDERLEEQRKLSGEKLEHLAANDPVAFDQLNARPIITKPGTPSGS